MQTDPERRVARERIREAREFAQRAMEQRRAELRRELEERMQEFTGDADPVNA